MAAQVINCRAYFEDIQSAVRFERTQRKIAELQARLVATRKRIEADLDRMEDNSWRAPSDTEVPFAG